jgi:PAS domain S-box-containing protein
VFSRSIATGTSYEIVQRLRRFDGHYRWFKNEGSPLRDAEGQIVGWCVLLTDIEEQMHAEAALRESERESHRIVESIPGLIVTLTESGVVAFENSRTRDYLGPELAGTIDWATNGIVHPEDVPRVFPQFMQGVESRAPFEYEVRLRRYDGAHRWFQLRAHPFTDAAGRVIHWYVLFTDIDDRKRAEEAIRASEQQFKLITDTIPALAWSALSDGSADFFNQHFLDFIGLTADQASGWGWTVAVHPQDVQELAQQWQRIIASGQPGETEARLRRHDGSYRWFLFRASPLRDERGAVSKWYGVNTDIEDRKRADQELRASELNLRQMTETIPEMLWSATPDGAIDYCNTRFLDYTGFAAAEVVNDGWQRTIHPEDAARAGPVWMESVATRVPYRVEVRTYHAADQTYRWCAVSALPLLDEDGHVIKWHGTIVDVHDWKQAQESLRRSEAFLAEAQRLSSTGSFSWIPEIREVAWSDEIYRIFGVDPGTPLTDELLDSRIHPEDAAMWARAMERARSGGGFSLDYRLQMPDNSVKYLHQTAHTTCDDAGRVEYIGAVQDVTERELSEQALDKIRSELAHVVRSTSLGALTASIAHEVNQPLSGIMTNAATGLRMLDATPPDIAGARETARRTLRDANRASDVITHLRALFSRREFAVEPLDLNEAAREVIALSASDLQRHHITLQSNFALHLPPIPGDRIQLQQVILNLLRNATEAMADVHDRPRRLLISTAREEDDGVRLSVRDSGVGFDPETMARLFGAFYTTKEGGMGIGLFVSRSIIERHQGRLWAAPNTDGPGSTFAFALPITAGVLVDEGPALGTT